MERANQAKQPVEFDQAINYVNKIKVSWAAACLEAQRPCSQYCSVTYQILMTGLATVYFTSQANVLQIPDPRKW